MDTDRTGTDDHRSESETPSLEAVGANPIADHTRGDRPHPLRRQRRRSYPDPSVLDRRLFGCFVCRETSARAETRAWWRARRAAARRRGDRWRPPGLRGWCRRSSHRHAPDDRPRNSSRRRRTRPERQETKATIQGPVGTKRTKHRSREGWAVLCPPAFGARRGAREAMPCVTGVVQAEAAPSELRVYSAPFFSVTPMPAPSMSRNTVSKPGSAVIASM
jgi:hypothetical protein